MNGFYGIEKERLTEEEKRLVLADLKGVFCEYFEGDDNYILDVTKTKKGYSVCLVFDAVRIRGFRRPR